MSVLKKNCTPKVKHKTFRVQLNAGFRLPVGGIYEFYFSPRALSRLEASGVSKPVKSVNICSNGNVFPLDNILSRYCCPISGFIPP